MTGRDMANLEAAAGLLQSGRTALALETIVQVIRENGGTVPVPPGGSEPPPAPQPDAMRASA